MPTPMELDVALAQYLFARLGPVAATQLAIALLSQVAQLPAQGAEGTRLVEAARAGHAALAKGLEARVVVAGPDATVNGKRLA